MQGSSTPTFVAASPAPFSLANQSPDQQVAQLNTQFERAFECKKSQNYEEVYRIHCQIARQQVTSITKPFIAKARYEVGLALLYGEGIKAHTSRAITIFRTAAQLGSAAAQYQLENLREQDPNDPFDWQKAVENDNGGESECYLAAKYLNGLNVTQNSQQAILLLTGAVNKQNPNAMFMLGSIYSRNQHGIPIDIELSKYWYNQAVQHGHLLAKSALESLNLHTSDNHSPPSRSSSSYSDDQIRGPQQTTLDINKLSANFNQISVEGKISFVQQLTEKLQASNLFFEQLPEDICIAFIDNWRNSLSQQDQIYVEKAEQKMRHGGNSPQFHFSAASKVQFLKKLYDESLLINLKNDYSQAELEAMSTPPFDYKPHINWDGYYEFIEALKIQQASGKQASSDERIAEATKLMKWCLEQGQHSLFAWHMVAGGYISVILKDFELDEKAGIFLSKVFRRNTQLTGLALQCTKVSSPGVKSISSLFQDNKTLQTFVLLSENFSSDPVNIEPLCATLQNNSTLTSLGLEKFKVGDEGAKHVSDLLKKNSTLTNLSLCVTQITPPGAQHLGSALIENNTLTSFSLEMNGDLKAKGCKHISDALKLNTTLKSMNLNQTSIGDEGAKYLSDAFKINTALNKLSLFDSDLKDTGMEAISEMLKVNTSLAELNVGSLETKITVTGQEALSKALEVNTGIAVLDVNSQDWCHEGVKALSDSLMVNTTLTDLNLYETNIDDTGAGYLSDMLRKNTSLTKLNLSGNTDITIDGASSLAEAFDVNSGLEELDLTGLGANWKW